MIQQRWTKLAIAIAVVACGVQANAQFTAFYTEDFDSLLGSLGPSVNERQGFPLVTREATDTDSAPIADAFTHTGPAGWAVDNTLATFDGAPTIGNAGVPAGGVEEWKGWSFAAKDFWSSVDGQGRGDFALGSGNVAVADPDEYYDLDLGPSDLGYYNTSLSTPSVAINGLGSSSAGVFVSFDTSYRLEATDDGHPDPAVDDLNNSAGELVAVFDTGEVQSFKVFDSLAGGSDLLSGTVEASFFPTTAATSAQYFFNLGNAGNDWWWAIDNVAVADIDINTGVPGAPTFTEDFEGVALGDSVNERVSLIASRVTAANDDTETTPRPDSFTHTPPTGWTRENLGPSTATPDSVDDNDGVFEWEGWSFATPEFWTFADTQQRETFTKGTGVIAIADGDEWDDLGAAGDNGLMDTLIESPEIALPALVDGETLELRFDSSWRDEDDNTAIVTVDYGDGNGPIEVLRWESDSNSAFFQDDAPNESVVIQLDPQGPTAIVAFQYIGGDDWWWAIDNVQLGVIPEPTSAVLVAVGLVGFAARRRV